MCSSNLSVSTAFKYPLPLLGALFMAWTMIYQVNITWSFTLISSITLSFRTPFTNLETLSMYSCSFSLPHFLPPLIPPAFTPSLPWSLQPSLSPSLDPSSPHSLPPSIPSALTLSLPSYLSFPPPPTPLPSFSSHWHSIICPSFQSICFPLPDSPPHSW